MSRTQCVIDDSSTVVRWRHPNRPSTTTSQLRSRDGYESKSKRLNQKSRFCTRLEFDSKSSSTDFQANRQCSLLQFESQFFLNFTLIAIVKQKSFFTYAYESTNYIRPSDMWKIVNVHGLYFIIFNIFEFQNFSSRPIT